MVIRVLVVGCSAVFACKTKVSSKTTTFGHVSNSSCKHTYLTSYDFLVFLFANLHSLNNLLHDPSIPL